jgi:hypothetical protein
VGEKKLLEGGGAAAWSGSLVSGKIRGVEEFILYLGFVKI